LTQVQGLALVNDVVGQNPGALMTAHIREKDVDPIYFFLTPSRADNESDRANPALLPGGENKIRD
jgi:hypothetical protein